MEQRTDSELVVLARGGDKAAFGQLIERHQQMVRHIVMGIIGSAEVARELAQEAMLQAYLSLEHLRDDTRFTGSTGSRSTSAGAICATRKATRSPSTPAMVVQDEAFQKFVERLIAESGTSAG